MFMPGKERKNLSVSCIKLLMEGGLNEQIVHRILLKINTTQNEEIIIIPRGHPGH